MNNKSLSEFVVSVGTNLENKKIPLEKLNNLREIFLSYFDNDQNLVNDLDDPVDGELFVKYLNKYFITPEILKATVEGWSSWSQVPIDDRFVTPEIIKGLLDAYDNGHGGNYSNALHYINGKKITPEIIDFITSLPNYEDDELQQLLDDIEGLSPETVERIKQVIGSEPDPVTEQIKRLVNLARKT